MPATLGRPGAAAGLAWLARAGFLEHGQDVPGRVTEPGDVGPVAAADSLAVLGQAVVALERHAAGGQLVHGGVDVVDPEVGDRVVRRDVTRLRVDERVPAARQMQGHQAVLLRGGDAEYVAVELLGRLQVIHGEAAEGPGVREHGHAGPLAGLPARAACHAGVPPTPDSWLRRPRRTGLTAARHPAAGRSAGLVPAPVNGR